MVIKNPPKISPGLIFRGGGGGGGLIIGILRYMKNLTHTLGHNRWVAVLSDGKGTGGEDV